MSTEQQQNDLQMHDFFEDSSGGELGRLGNGAGRAAMLFIHAALIFILLYSAVHGVSASLGFAGNSMWQKVAQVAGIIMIEAVAISIHVAYHNGAIRGGIQPLVAAATYLLCFFLSILGILADSQINAGLDVAGWVQVYLHWGLPIAPMVVGLGAIVIHVLAPEKVRMREQINERESFESLRFQADMAKQRAELAMAKAAANMRLNAVAETMRQVHDVYRSDEVQEAIRRQALNNLPQILRAAGIDATGLRDRLLPPPPPSRPALPSGNAEIILLSGPSRPGIVRDDFTGPPANPAVYPAGGGDVPMHEPGPRFILQHMLNGRMVQSPPMPEDVAWQRAKMLREQGHDEVHIYPVNDTGQVIPAGQATEQRPAAQSAPRFWDDDDGPGAEITITGITTRTMNDQEFREYWYGEKPPETDLQRAQRQLRETEEREKQEEADRQMKAYWAAQKKAREEQERAAEQERLRQEHQKRVENFNNLVARAKQNPLADEAATIQHQKYLGPMRSDRIRPGLVTNYTDQLVGLSDGELGYVLRHGDVEQRLAAHDIFKTREATGNRRPTPPASELPPTGSSSRAPDSGRAEGGKEEPGK